MLGCADGACAGSDVTCDVGCCVAGLRSLVEDFACAGRWAVVGEAWVGPCVEDIACDGLCVVVSEAWVGPCVADGALAGWPGGGGTGAGEAACERMEPEILWGSGPCSPEEKAAMWT